MDNRNIDPTLLQMDKENGSWTRPMNVTQQQAIPMYAAHTGSLGTNNGNAANHSGNTALIQSNSNQIFQHGMVMGHHQLYAQPEQSPMPFPPPLDLNMLRNHPMYQQLEQDNRILREKCDGMKDRVMELQTEINRMQTQMLLLQQTVSTQAVKSSTPPPSANTSSSLPAPPAASAVSTAGLDPHQAFLAATMVQQVVLNKDDYLGRVRFWDKPSTTKKTKTVKVASTSDIDEEGPSDNETTVNAYKSNSQGVYNFLEKDDGTLWDVSDKEALLKEARSYWNQYINMHDMTDNFSSIKAIQLQHFRNYMESRFPALRLCSRSWKADMIWLRNYHSWKNTAVGRVERVNVASNVTSTTTSAASSTTTSGSGPSSSDNCQKGKKQGKRAVVYLSTSESDVSSNEKMVTKPPPKKPKTSTHEAKVEQTVNATLKHKKKPLSSSSASSVLLGFRVNVADLEKEISGGPSKLTSVSAAKTRQPPPTTSTRIIAPPSQLTNSDMDILKRFRRRVETLPATIPLAPKTHPLAIFNKPGTQLTGDITSDDDIWEAWDPRLNALIPEDIKMLEPLVARGKNGLIALVSLFEHLVHDRHVLPGMLSGKAKRIMAAIDRKCPAVTTSVTPGATAASTGPGSKATASSSKNGKPPKTRALARWALPTGPVPEAFAAQDFREQNKYATKKEWQEWWEEVQQDRKGDRYKKYANMAKEARKGANSGNGPGEDLVEEAEADGSAQG
ncbi:hypothetical protein V5O48_014237 [Marasmius crinis-equi]|uniref:Uncharacterized protein n=1 Tax=Marasmius crinis-equi TaxID=585013 RepID=A0ABR3EXU8_9AGAR